MMIYLELANVMHDIDKSNNEGVARDCQGESREILAIYVATDIICRCVAPTYVHRAPMHR